MRKEFLLLFILPVFVFGQKSETNNKNSTDLKNEFGINIYSLTGIKYCRYFEPHVMAIHFFFNGVYYKHYFNKNGLRTSFDLYQKANHSEFNSGFDYYRNISIYEAGELKIGYERLIFINKLIPFAFVDIIYNYSEENGYYSYCNASYSLGYTDTHFLIKKSQFSSAIGVGLNYRPINNLVISIEANYQFIYSISKDTKNSTNKYQNTDFKFNLVRTLSVGLIF